MLLLTNRQFNMISKSDIKKKKFFLIIFRVFIIIILKGADLCIYSGAFYNQRAKRLLNTDLNKNNQILMKQNKDIVTMCHNILSDITSN